MHFLFKLILVSILITGSIFPQQKYLIYFNDKGETGNILLKPVERNKVAVKTLSAKSINRRIKTLGTDKYFDYDDLPVPEKYISRLRELDIRIINKLKWFNAVSAYLTFSQVEKVKALPFVKKIEPVKKIKIRRKPVTLEEKTLYKNTNFVQNYKYDYGPSFGQYELSQIPEVHNLGITAKGVTIGILDNGFRWKAVSSLMNANVLAEYDFIFHDSVTSNQPGDVKTQDTHGTQVFSILAGFDEGMIVGPAFDADFILAKTEDNRSETHVEEDNYAAALEWMDSLGVDITTSSLGYSQFDDSGTSYTYADMDGKTTIVTRAAEKAFKKGILTITSAGNEGNKNWHYITAPADGFRTLAIGAVTPANVVASFSSRGPSYDGRVKPDLVAQGVSVYNAYVVGNTYVRSAGTSMSAPIAAGVAGLLLSAYPGLNNRQLRHILLETGDNSANPDYDRGYGLISAARAISFPNIVKKNGTYILRKAFVDSTDIDSSSVMFFYHLANSDVVVPVKMNKNGFHYETTEVNTVNGEIEFWFEVHDTAGNVYRYPESGNYSWESGKENVYFNLPKTEARLPEEFYLSQNYPNPFNGFTTIKYDVPFDENNETLQIKLTVYDILGRKVATLVDKYEKPGTYEILFNGNNLSSGVYIYRLRGENFVQTRKMLLLK